MQRCRGRSGNFRVWVLFLISVVYYPSLALKSPSVDGCWGANRSCKGHNPHLVLSQWSGVITLFTRGMLSTVTGPKAQFFGSSAIHRWNVLKESTLSICFSKSDWYCSSRHRAKIIEGQNLGMDSLRTPESRSARWSLSGNVSAECGGDA